MPELVCAASDREAWLAARRAGVTATDIVTILGLSSWDSPYSLYWRKLGEIPEVPDNDRFRLGRELEPYILGRWGEEHDDLSYTCNGPELWRSTVRPWQLTTPDAVVLDSRGVTTAEEAMRGAATVGVLEVKTWADADRHAWDDGPPAKVRAQVLWQMDVMDVPRGDVGVVFLPSGEFASHVIEHTTTHSDEAAGVFTGCPACCDLQIMREAGAEFMARLRGELPPPDPDESMATLAAVRARFPKREGKRGQVDADLWNMWVMEREQIKIWEERARLHETALREELGECDEIEADGQLVGRRVIVDAKVRAHVRHQDYIKRLDAKGDDGAA